MNEIHDLEKYSLTDLENALSSSTNKDKDKDKGAADKSIPSRDSELSSLPPMSIARALIEKQRIIYGVDDRKDLYEVENKKYLKAADSVVALFTKDQIKDMGDETSELSLDNFGDSYNLCSGEKFREQPIGAFCSGFLVAPDKIATAGHCVDEDGSNLDNIRFVFGFKMNGAGDPTLKINNSEIYKGTSILGWKQDELGEDWTVVKLDRPVENHTPVKVRKEGRIDDNAPLYVIGCPCGLPMKFADGAVVKDNNPDHPYIVANLDTYGGNSGSPVFYNSTSDTEPPLVEGILVRGDRDFKPVGNCSISFVCPANSPSQCDGEEVTRATKFANLIDSE
jgi:hypothetical protein